MPETSFKDLLDAGVHFGHLKRKWNPAMSPYIFMEKSGIHIIDLHKTEVKLNEAASAMKQIAKSGRKILFVATKKQAKDIVAEKVKAINMPYVTERWPGGMLTNFPTIRKAVKKMSAIDKMAVDGTFDTLSKRERLQITRQRAKLEKNLGSISDLTRLPAAMFIVDVHKEYIAVREANRLNIPVFAMVDTNSDPRNIDFPIPSNDDASKSISLIIDYVTDAVAEGLGERKMEKEKEAKDAKSKGAAKGGEAPAATEGAESTGKERSDETTKESGKAATPESGRSKGEGRKERERIGRKVEIKDRKEQQPKIAEVKEEQAEVKKEEPKAEVKKEEPKAEVKEEKPLPKDLKPEAKNDLSPQAKNKEEPKAEVKEEKAEVKKEEPKAEVKEEKAEVKEEKAEVKEEPKAEVKEEPKAEVKEEPKAEVKAEEKKAE